MPRYVFRNKGGFSEIPMSNCEFCLKREHWVGVGLVSLEFDGTGLRAKLLSDGASVDD